jgi:predicted phosphodiesterase
MNKNIQHDMLQALLNLAQELGRTPTKVEYEAAGNSDKQMRKEFGTYTAFLDAAGLEQLSRSNKKKIDNSIFNVDIEKHINRFTQESDKIDPIKAKTSNGAILSDIHWPFHHAEKMELFFKRMEKKKYDFVCINGDAVDFYSHATFPRSHNIFTPKEECDLARKLNEDFWKRVKKINPKAKCYQTLGNHSIRPIKRILESYPAAEDWIKEAMEKMFKFDGVTTLSSPRDFILLNDEIAIMHGYKSQLGAHRDQHLMSCIVGHTHRPGIVYRRMMNKVIVEANSGLMGNPAAKGLTYTASKLTEWVNGFLEIDDAGLRFIVL